jgi:hypothetical protein
MALDPSIALGVRPAQIESPINQMAKMYELQNAAQSNQLNKLKMDEYTRGVAEDTEIKNALTRLDKNSPTYEQDRFNAYALKGIEGVKAYAATKKEEAAAEEHAAGTAGKKLSNTEASVKLAKAAQSEILEYPSEAMVTSYYEDAKRKGLYDPETLSNIERFTNIVLSVPAPINPATGEPDFTARRQAITRLQLEAKDRLSKPGQRNLNNVVEDIMTDPITGKTFVTGTSKMGISPADAQRIALDKQRVKLESQRVSEGNRRDVVASTLTDAAGNVTQYNKFGELIGTKPNAGKPSATFEKTKAAKQQLGLDLDLAIKELTEATKEGGLIETATGSGAGALRDIGAGFFGETTAGAEALGALQPIYDKVLKMVPRFEGPQSDKDTISYNKAAGDLGNPNAPTGKKLAAAKTILRLMKDRKAEFLTRDLAEGGAVPNAGGDVDASNPLLN